MTVLIVSLFLLLRRGLVTRPTVPMEEVKWNVETTSAVAR
jgi:hypothetical protein